MICVFNWGQGDWGDAFDARVRIIFSRPVLDLFQKSRCCFLVRRGGDRKPGTLVQGHMASLVAPNCYPVLRTT